MRARGRLGRLAGALARWFGLTTALATALASVAFAAYLVFVPRRETVVPNVVGATALEALEALSRSDLRPLFGGRRPHRAVPAGRVIEQQPAPGSRQRPGATVRLVFSLGAGTVAVPSLIGATLRQAELDLGRDDLTLGVVSRVPVADRPEDTVLAQSPVAGEEVAPGRAVDLLITAPPRARRYVAPDFRGMDVRAAYRRLDELGLTVATIREVRADLPPGSILAQDPEPGAPMTKDQPFALTVSAASSP